MQAGQTRAPVTEAAPARTVRWQRQTRVERSPRRTVAVAREPDRDVAAAPAPLKTQRPGLWDGVWPCCWRSAGSAGGGCTPLRWMQHARQDGLELTIAALQREHPDGFALVRPRPELKQAAAALEKVKWVELFCHLAGPGPRRTERPAHRIVHASHDGPPVPRGIGTADAVGPVRHAASRAVGVACSPASVTL